MKIRSLLMIAGITLLAASCGKGKRPPKMDYDPISISKPAKGDHTIYGLACDGCTDSAVILLPNAGGNPVTYNILEAKKAGKIFGTPKIGDWLGIIQDPKNKHKALLVVDLDEVKGTWTYQVMPKLKDVNGLGHLAIRKMIQEMPDSVKNTYMIPRQYGFTLARQSVASPVGMVRTTTLDNDSPVEYPKVRWYTEWHAYNGKLILIQGRYEFQGTVFNSKTIRDTLDFVYLKDDSLALNYKGKIIGFHRQANARAANAKANAAVNRQEKKEAEELK